MTRTTTHVPDPVARIGGLMASFERWWALCGGWAVDAWLGRQTREHVDVDLAVFHDDERDVFDRLSSWRLVAHDELVDQETTEPWNGRHLELPAHVHAHGDDGFELEVLVNERSGDDWILSSEPRIVVPVSSSTRTSRWGVPTVVPEILLFYKGTAYFGDEAMRSRRSHDDVDFEALVDHLSAGARAWLTGALSVLYPEHPWLRRLAAR